MVHYSGRDNRLEVDGVPHLERRFSFPDFAHARTFTNQVGALAEAEGQHPALLTDRLSLKARA